MRFSSSAIALAGLLFVTRFLSVTADFTTYLDMDADCPEDSISDYCEDQEVGDCCNGRDGVLYQSATASDDQENIILYTLRQGQNENDGPNKCGIQVAIDNDGDDVCASTDIAVPAGAGVKDDDHDPLNDGGPTDGDEDGESDGGGDQRRSIAGRSFMPTSKKAKRSPEMRSRSVDGHAVRNKHGAWHLPVDSEHAATWRSLTDRGERVTYMKRHGTFVPKKA